MHASSMSRTTILGLWVRAFVVAFVLTPWSLMAQSAANDFTVEVLDEEATPVFNALVQMGEQVMFTDGDGKVSFPCVEGVVVKVFAEDHETQWMDSVDCQKGNMTVVLKALEVRISEAVVEEVRDIGGVPPTEIMDARNIEEIPSSTGIPDLMSSLKTSAAIRSNTEGQKGIVSRGGNYDQACIAVDGFPIVNSTHLFGLLSMFQTSAIRGAELFINDKPIGISSNLGTVVHVSLNEQFSPGPQWSGNVLSSVIASELQIQRSAPNTFCQVSGRRSNLELIQGLIDQTINTRSSRSIAAIYGFHDVSIKAAWIFGKHKLESVLLKSSDEVRYDIDFTASERAYENLTNWTNELAGVRWTWFIRDHWRLEGKGGASHYGAGLVAGRTWPVLSGEEGVTVSQSRSSFANDIGAKRVSLMSHWKRKRLKSILGVQWESHEVNPRFDQTTDGAPVMLQEEASSRAPLRATSAFVDVDVAWSESLKGNVGMRQTHWRMEDGTSLLWLPKASLTLRLNDAHGLMLHSSRSMQGIHLVTLNDFGFVPELWLPASQHRPVEEAWQSGLRWTLSLEDTRLSVDAFVRGMSGLLEFQSGVDFGQSLDEVLAEDVASDGLGAAFGAEFTAHHERDRVEFDVAYSFGRSSRRFSSLNGGRPFPFSFDIRHDATSTFRWNMNKAWSFTCMHVYSTGRWLNISENQIPLAMANPSASPNVVWTSYAAPQVRNAYRLGMLSRMDVSISWEKKRERGDWRTQVGVYNVTNRVNPYAAIWSETDDGEPFIEEIGLIPLLPNASLSYTWN